MAQFYASGTSGLGAALNVDQAAPGAGSRLILKTVAVTFSGDPTVGTLITVESPAGTVRERHRVAAGERTVRFPCNIEAAPNSGARVAVAGAGVTVTSEVLFSGEIDNTV